MAEPVVVVTHPHVHLHDADLSRLERDALVLTAEERRWGRRRVTTQAGRTLALALPTGSVLTASVARPVALRVTGPPNGAPSIENWAVPVAMGPLEGVTRAVNVTD